MTLGFVAILKNALHHLGLQMNPWRYLIQTTRALGRKEEHGLGVVREDILQEADYRHSLDYAKNLGGKRKERMEGMGQCFPKGNLWN